MAMLFVSGCSKNSKRDESEAIPSAQVIPEDNAQEQDDDEFDKAINTTLDFSEYLSKKIFNQATVCATSSNYAVIRSGTSLGQVMPVEALQGDYGDLFLYNVVDKKSKCCGSFLAAYDAEIVINNDGLMSMRDTYYNGQNKTRILDKTGAVLLDGTLDAQNIVGQGVTYYPITDSGNTLRATMVSGFEHGEGVCVEMITSEGKVLSEVATGSEMSIGYVGNNIFSIRYHDDSEDKYHSILCNVKTKKIKEMEKDIPGGGFPYNYIFSEKLLNAGGIFVTEDLETWNSYNRDTPYDCYSPMSKFIEDPEMTWFIPEDDIGEVFFLNDKYFYQEDGIYNMDSSIAKKITEGEGIKKAAYRNEYYCIESNTGYFYSLDKKLNPIAEPVQFGEKNSLIFTDYGIIAIKDDRSGFSLYDFDGSLLSNIEGEDNIKVDVNNFTIPHSFTYANYNLASRSVMKITVFDEKVPVYYGQGTGLLF